MRRAALLLALMLAPSLAAARTVEPGTTWGTAGVGLGFKASEKLGGSGSFLLLNIGGEYALSKSLSAVGELSLGNLGFIGSVPLRLRGGARYRLVDLDLPVSPYAQGQLSVGRLFDVIGANVSTWGIRVGAGGDYFLTAHLSVGALVAWELARTTGPRPVGFSHFELLAVASYALF